jgi:arabinose-5-phosphate isomerase
MPNDKTEASLESSLEAQSVEIASQVLAIEAQALVRLRERLSQPRQSEAFERAVALVAGCAARVVVTGVGKSGHIARKIASTLSSTGTPSLFMHAGEALHGDLGMVAPGDVLLAVSYSGRSDELTGILPVVAASGVPIIAITGSGQSFLAARADVVLDISVEREACPLNLAPTASTVAALAMGDALAVCAMERRGFSAGDFARTHPGGALGRSARLSVGELMRTGERLALVAPSNSVREALGAITRAQSGSACVAQDGVLQGYLTDGDVRRRLLSCDDAEVLLRLRVDEVMTRSPLSFSPRMAAVDALRALQDRGVDDAPVVDEDSRAVGILDVQELLRSGVL